MVNKLASVQFEIVNRLSFGILRSLACLGLPETAGVNFVFSYSQSLEYLLSLLLSLVLIL
jgi:hypothetical protein